MRIFDQTMQTELTREQCDFTQGYLTPAKLMLGKRKSLIERTKDKDGNIAETTYPSLDITEDILVYMPFSEKDKVERRIIELQEWFNTEYREQFEKCTRRIELGIKMRDGTDPKSALAELYQKAEEVADTINDLEGQLKKLQ